MSRVTENAQHLSFLLRTIPEEVFSFIVVQCNHASFVVEVEAAIASQYPARKIQKVTYPLPSDKTIGILAEEMGEGVLMVTNFEEILKDSTSWRVFNQTRDKVSSFPISLIVFIPIAPGVIRFMMQNMRDFWSIRNLVVEFWKEPTVEPVLLMDPFLEHSTDANLSKEEKQELKNGLLSDFLHFKQNSKQRKSISDETTLHSEEIELAVRYLHFLDRIHAYADIVEFSSVFGSQNLNLYINRNLRRAYKELGDFTSAEKLSNEALLYYKDNFDLGHQILFYPALLNLIDILLAQNKLGEAKLCLMHAEEFRDDQSGDQINFQKHPITIRWGYYHLLSASPSEAIQSFQSALNHLPTDGDQLARNMVVSNLAEAYLVSGDYYTAYETAMQAYQEVHKIGDLYLESILLFQLGRIKVAQGLPELGKPYLKEAIRISEYLGSPKLGVMQAFAANA